MSRRIPAFLNSPRLLRWVLNFYGPFLGAGIHVMHIADDYSAASVRMKLRFFNKNYVGTHFGGSLFSMTDPFFMLLVMNRLGRDYIVWDKAGSIDYLKPGRGTVIAHFAISENRLDDIRQHCANGEKYLPVFSVDVLDSQGDVVARISKTLYIRKKPA